jgi:DNA-binding winged helix-turn-helix (wHTH) protein
MPALTRTKVRFGPFELDPQSGELVKLGQKLNLHGQPIEVLSILLEHSGELITREEFCQRLWPQDTFVDFEHSLNTAIKKLRQTLDDDPDAPRYIETLSKRGTASSRQSRPSRMASIHRR